MITLIVLFQLNKSLAKDNVTEIYKISLSSIFWDELISTFKMPFVYMPLTWKGGYESKRRE